MSSLRTYQYVEMLYVCTQGTYGYTYQHYLMLSWVPSSYGYVPRKVKKAKQRTTARANHDT